MLYRAYVRARSGSLTFLKNRRTENVKQAATSASEEGQGHKLLVQLTGDNVQQLKHRPILRDNRRTYTPREGRMKLTRKATEAFDNACTIEPGVQVWKRRHIRLNISAA